MMGLGDITVSAATTWCVRQSHRPHRRTGQSPSDRGTAHNTRAFSDQSEPRGLIIVQDISADQ